MDSPRVSVIMPVYNGEQYLCEAIESILNQTFTSLELLAIDDASKDRSVEIIKSYDDDRVKLIENEKNLGTPFTMNKGMEEAKGEYIAFFGCDDISHPNRLERQINFMDSNPDIGVCGTWLRTFGGAEENVLRFPIGSDIIKASMLFQNPLVGGSVMMQKKMVTDAGFMYDPEYRLGQDFELWERMSRYCEFANIPEVLYFYRMHQNQTSRQNKQKQKMAKSLIRKRQFELLGIVPTKEEIELHEIVSHWKFESTKNFLFSSQKWLHKLSRFNNGKKLYPEPAFSQVLAQKWFRICNDASNLGLWSWRTFYSSPFNKFAGLNLIQHVKFFIKCSIRWQGRNS